MNILQHNIETAQKAVAEAAAAHQAIRESWARLQVFAEAVFQAIASRDGDASSMTKEELVAANAGDFKLFHEMDTVADGQISSEEWHGFLQRTHEEKSVDGGWEKGEEWLSSKI